jgi:hypothetical protein
MVDTYFYVGQVCSYRGNEVSDVEGNLTVQREANNSQAVVK